MALTIDIVKRVALPAGRAVVADITFDSSYPTGGEAITAAELGLNAIEHVQVAQKGVASRICEYDPSAGTLMLFTALSTEATNGSNQSSIVVRALVIGDNVGPTV